jgi:hypothetical protein
MPSRVALTAGAGASVTTGGEVGAMGGPPPQATINGAAKRLRTRRTIVSLDLRFIVQGRDGVKLESLAGQGPSAG